MALAYAIDSSVNKLKDKGIESAVIGSDGITYCLGDMLEGSMNSIKVDTEAVLSQEIMFDEAIASYGNGSNDGLVSVAIINKNCVSAYGLSKAFYAMGEQGVGRFISMVPSTMRVFLFFNNNGKKRVKVFK